MQKIYSEVTESLLPSIGRDSFLQPPVSIKHSASRVFRLCTGTLKSLFPTSQSIGTCSAPTCWGFGNVNYTHRHMHRNTAHIHAHSHTRARIQYTHAHALLHRHTHTHTSFVSVCPYLQAAWPIQLVIRDSIARTGHKTPAFMARLLSFCLQLWWLLISPLPLCGPRGALNRLHFTNGKLSSGRGSGVYKYVKYTFNYFKWIWQLINKVGRDKHTAWHRPL